jgi:hypothetical protein
MPAALKMVSGSGFYVSDDLTGGAEGNRTPDLLNAIQALSQLSYGPSGIPGKEALGSSEARGIATLVQGIKCQRAVRQRFFR